MLGGRNGAIGVGLVLFGLGVTSCHADSSSAPPASQPPPTTCGSGFDLVSGGCVPRSTTCKPHEIPRADGSCLAVGVPVDGCGDGFTNDGTGGCSAVLPTAPCARNAIALPGDTSCKPVGVIACALGFVSDGTGGCTATLPSADCDPGSFAVPGESACHQVSACGTGPWGEIPVDATTLYVDASSKDGGDGSATKPFVSIGAAVTAARDGAPTIIAIASGKYAENVTTGKAVKLWGRCPAMVEIHGVDLAAPTIELDGDGGEMHDLSITGTALGVRTKGEHVVLDRLWVHDLPRFGVDAESGSVTVSRSLIEKASITGVSVSSAALTLESSVVRDTEPAADGTLGWGISVVTRVLGRAATLTVRGSIVERNLTTGVYVQGATATIEASLVRDTKPRRSDGQLGRGLDVEDDESTKKQASIALKGSIVERNADQGIFVTGSSATLESSIVRDTKPRPDGTYGRGLYVTEDDVTRLPATVTLRSSLVERNTEVGVYLVGATADIDGSILRDQLPRPSDRNGGDAVSATVSAKTKTQSQLTLTHSLVDHNTDISIALIGSKATVDSSVIRDTQPRPSDEKFGRGVALVDEPKTLLHAELTLRRSILDHNADSALSLYGSDATLESTLIRDTQPIGDGRFGVGLSAFSDLVDGERSSLTVRGSVFEKNHVASMFLGSADVEVATTVVRDSLVGNVAGGQIGSGILSVLEVGRPAGVLKVHDSLVERVAGVGIFVGGNVATVERCIVRDSRPYDTHFGDGLEVVREDDTDSDVSSLSVVSSIVQGSERVAAGVVSATLTLQGTLLTCSGVDIDHEFNRASWEPKIVDGGGNWCGCTGALRACKSATGGVEAMVPPPPPERH